MHEIKAITDNFEKADLSELGKKAFSIKHEKFGQKVFWIRNVHINYTNICLGECGVCRYSKKKGQAGGYVLEIDEIVNRVGRAVAGGAAEVHIVGGINPEIRFQYYQDLVREIRRSFPGLFIKAYTASEIEYMSKIGDLELPAVLGRLIEAGLNSMPGGGAEIFSERVRKELFPNKISAARWLEVHRTAHRLGLRTTATMLFGHIETFPERAEHLLLLKRLQEETHGFDAFVPLPVVGYGKLKGIDGLDALRTLAISRNVLDNFDHIKVFWPIWSLKLSQLALSYGADDFDGTVGEYKIVDQSGIPSTRVVALIQEAGFEAAERNGRYETGMA
jgi:aminodeoxyfutalosine synthase